MADEGDNALKRHGLKCGHCYLRKDGMVDRIDSAEPWSVGGGRDRSSVRGFRVSYTHVGGKPWLGGYGSTGHTGLSKFSASVVREETAPPARSP